MRRSILYNQQYNRSVKLSFISTAPKSYSWAWWHWETSYFFFHPVSSMLLSSDIPKKSEWISFSPTFMPRRDSAIRMVHILYLQVEWWNQKIASLYLFCMTEQKFSWLEISVNPFILIWFLSESILTIFTPEQCPQTNIVQGWQTSGRLHSLLYSIDHMGKWALCHGTFC